MADVPGFLNLECLTLSGSAVEWAWCFLPELKTLCIDQNCKLICPSEWPSIPHVKSLQLCRSAQILSPDDSIYDMELFLEGLRTLPRLEVVLCNFPPQAHHQSRGNWEGYINETAPGDFDYLMGCLAPMEPTLEELKISEYVPD